MGVLGPVVGPFARSAVVVILAVFGAVAAFATIAPSPDAQFLLSRTSSIEALPIPAEALLPSPASYIREERFQRGDTLAAFLLRLGITDSEVAPLARQRAFQALRPGYNVAAEVSAEGRLVALSFLTSRDTLVQVSREGGRDARWARSGRELFFMQGGRMFAAPIDSKMSNARWNDSSAC